jgi:hypothetical protein
VQGVDNVVNVVFVVITHRITDMRYIKCALPYLCPFMISKLAVVVILCAAE